MKEQIRTYRDGVVFITGGASGIGAALGRALVGAGARVVLADRDQELAAELCERLGPRAQAAALDVRDAAGFESALVGVWQQHGRLDYLFNNAGVAVAGEVKDQTLDDWEYLVDVNLKSVIHGIHAAYPRMVRQGFGHIVNTASMAGLGALPYGAGYATTKHAVVGLSRSLRLEAKRHGVRVSVICPGAIRTPILVNGGRHGRVNLPVPVETQIEFWERLRPMDPDRFADKVLRQVERSASIIVQPAWWRVIWWLDRLSPDFTDWMVGRAQLRNLAALGQVPR